MRRIAIAVILVLSLVVTSSNSMYVPQGLTESFQNTPNSPVDVVDQAEAQGLGSNILSVQYMDRMITNQILSISNEYVNPDSHIASIDLSSYQLPGWTLYQVQVDTENITAIAEKEILGASNDISGFEIWEYNDVFAWRYNSLAQGFYKMPHDGQLLNYSFYYDSPIYSPATHGWAYYSVLSDYADASTNLVAYSQLPTHVLSGPAWENATVPSVDLNANTEYFVVVNGSALTKGTYYPDIQWFAEIGSGLYDSEQYDSRYPLWGPYSCEALLNYTYIPWNTTANAALVFSDPSLISLNMSGAPVSGSSWIVSSGSNITAVQFSTNQSVNVFHNLTLRYKKDVTAYTNWDIISSVSSVMWNVTVDLVYPVVPEAVVRYMDITSIPLDWVATDLYLGSTPGYSYSQVGSNVTCTSLSDGLWTLTSTAPNYVTDLALSDSSDSSPISYKVANTVDMDIEATISMDGGLANLSILKTGSLVYSPAEIPASGGAAAFLWNIDSTTTGNGTHSVEVYWVSTDGLEAGYYTQEVFVYHSTTLVADEYSISAFTENTFSIGIDFDEIYPARGLDDIPADVTYSFGSVVNASMSNPSGGRWTQIVDTTGMSSGLHTLTVYAEGYALENRSLTISVSLEIETQALNWSWSPSNDIQYLESTNLTVSYWDLSDTGISGAEVNITFDSITYDLHWDALSGNYWIQLNGSDFLETNGTTVMILQAWSMGYLAQYNDTISITVHEQAMGTSLIVNWNPVDRNITYIESIKITASYTYNSAPITDAWLGASVNATFSGHPLVNMVYNVTSQMWEATLDGSLYLGVTTVTIRATATGYGIDASTPVNLIVTEDIPTLANSWTDSAASTDYNTNILLQITVRDSSGAFINNGVVLISIFGSEYPMTFDANGVYNYTIDPHEIRGVHVVNVTIAETGFIVTSMFLDLTVRAITDIDVDYLSSEYEQWNLTITVTFTDTFYDTPISDGTVTVTIDGEVYNLLYDSSFGIYVGEIMLDFDPSIYTITVDATGPYCNDATQSPTLEIMAKTAVFLTLTTEGDASLAGQRLEVIATLLYNGTETPVPNEVIVFTVTIYFVNGTVEVLDNPTLQRDRTNDAGVASWGFDIPSGNIERIQIHAEYAGSRVLWAADLIQDVGVGTNPLMLLISFFFFEDAGRLILLSFILLGIVATAYNKKVKPKKRLARLSLENQLQMFRDLESLRHFMAVYLDRGTCVFYHPFTEERIQPDLISGFIAAITSVYGEIKGDGVRGTLEEIQYQGLRLNSYSGEFIIGILILEGEMTPLLKERLQFFVELFENQYDQELSDWNGLIDCFDREWVVSTLTSAYNYSWLLPHRIVPTQKVGKIDARILDYIAAVRDERNEFHFKDLLTPLAEMLEMTEAEVLDRLLSLEDRGVIVPASIQTILQRQGMGLANGEFLAEVTPDEIDEEEKSEPEKEKESKSKKKKPSKVEEPEPVEDTLEWEPDEAEESVEKEEPAKEIDPMDEFVKDVEDLLTKEKEKDTKED